MPASVIQRSFHAGELAPALHARADQAKYQAGLRTCVNFTIRKEGGASSRAGFRFVQACKTTSASVELAPFIMDDPEESLLLEIGLGYIRIFQQAAPLIVDISGVSPWDIATNWIQGDLVKQGGIIYYAKIDNVGQTPPNATYWHPFSGGQYEIPTPFTHLPNWAQSGHTLTLTHRDEAPYDLVMLSLTHWVLQAITTVPTIAAPTGLGLTIGAAGTRAVAYVVTAAGADYQESEPSTQVIDLASADPTAQAPNVLAWTAVPGAIEYYVYADHYHSGVYGFLGTSTTLSFSDVGTIPDFAITPPVAQVMFAAAGTYPHISAVHQQRRVFASSLTEPDGVWLSRTGYYSNFSISSPLQSDDAITFRLAGNSNHRVERIVSLKTGLILFTSIGEWTVGTPREPLAPDNLPTDQETYVGIADVRPVIIGNAVVYVQARGRMVHDLRFDQEVEGLGGRDLTVWATHLTAQFGLTDLDYQQNPDSIVWAVRGDGTLIGITYLRDQEIVGWHRQVTQGAFWKVCVVPEPSEDALYVIVARTIGGTQRMYIERLERRAITPQTYALDAFFVDSGLTYSGGAVTTLTGLGHLEGQTVWAVADGTPVGPLTVTSGAVTLPTAASVVHVGLPYTCDLETLDLDVSGSNVRDQQKRVNSVTLLLEDSTRAFKAGPDFAHLKTNVAGTWETFAPLFTGQDEIVLPSEFGRYGRVCIRIDQPLPLTVLGVIPNVEIGG
jgi:hypothetical protein